MNSYLITPLDIVIAQPTGPLAGEDKRAFALAQGCHKLLIRRVEVTASVANHRSIQGRIEPGSYIVYGMDNNDWNPLVFLHLWHAAREQDRTLYSNGGSIILIPIKS